MNRQTQIGFWGLVIVITFTVLLLATAMSSCTPEARKKRSDERAERRYIKLTNKHPELIETKKKVDSSTVSDSGTIKAKVNEEKEAKIDSILAPLAPCDPDTVIRWKIKKEFKDRTHESIMEGNAQIFRLTNGTFVLTAKGNDLNLVAHTTNVNTETTVYMPNERCMQEKKAMEEQHKKEIEVTKIKWFGMGMLGLLLLILLGFALLKWGFK